jgi:hypothetical protein
MNYQFSVKATEAHDGELAEFEADSLEEAIKMFADSFPEDIGNIECITSCRMYGNYGALKKIEFQKSLAIVGRVKAMSFFVKTITTKKWINN